jgi:undecaprenyl-phosphate galactose phosphotransferase
MKPIIRSFLKRNKLKFSRKIESIFLAALDVVAILLAVVIVDFFRIASSNSELGPSPNSWFSLAHWPRDICLILIALVSFSIKGHYSKRKPYWSELREVVNVTLAMAFIDVALIFFGKFTFSRTALISTWILVPSLLVLFRASFKYLSLSFGQWTRPMVIIGTGENAIEAARAFNDELFMGFKIVAFLNPESESENSSDFIELDGEQIACFSIGCIEETLKNLGEPHIVIALDRGGIDAYQGLIQQLNSRDEDLQIVPSLRGLPLYGMQINHFFSHEVIVLTVRNNLARRAPQLVKRGFDLVVSVMLMLIGAPLLLWIAAKVRASGGPVIYKHKRVGQHGKHFYCYKFCSMLPNSDQLLQDLLDGDPEARAEWEKDFKLKNDPRITPIGEFIRKTSLDELPQLWNVLKGEMSLVGPRPIIDAELERYGNQVDYYLQAKPGITGLWQISGRNDITYESRVYLDTWYVKNWSLFSDLVILISTLKVVLKKDGAY